MRHFRDAQVDGFCGPLISVALVPEDVNFAPFYEAIDCADPTAGPPSVLRARPRSVRPSPVRREPI
jgi:hypothetical protein